MEKIQVEMVAKKLVKPSSPTPDSLRLYNLSFLDQIAVRTYVSGLYFCQLAEGKNMQDATTTREVVEQLEKSLSQLLSCYYPLAGRLLTTNDEFLSVVECKDQGVEFDLAKINNCKLDGEFIKNAYQDNDLLRRLAPSKIIDDLATAAPVRVQITIFECGGLVVASNILHTIADGFTMVSFITEWAKMNRISGISKQTKLTSSFNSGSLIFPASKNMKTTLIPKMLGTPQNANVTRRLVFDGTAIQNLKDQVKLDRQPSKVEVVTAFLWSGLVRAARARHGYLRPSMTSLSVNLRGKTALSIPDKAFGNMYIPVPIKFLANDDEKSKTEELHYFVVIVRNSIQKAIAECGQASRDDLACLINRSHKEMQEWVAKDGVDARFASSLCRFPMYETDFGWGKPSLYTIPGFGMEMFMLIDTKCGTGIEVILTLNQTEMKILQSDSYMASFM